MPQNRVTSYKILKTTYNYNLEFIKHIIYIYNLYYMYDTNRMSVKSVDVVDDDRFSNVVETLALMGHTLALICLRVGHHPDAQRKTLVGNHTSIPLTISRT
jgi:hypothetical protein